MVLAAVVCVSGCALGINGPAANRPRNEVPQCDTSKGAVALDGLFATLFGLGAIAAFSDGSEGSGIALAGASTLFVASAIRGSNAANDCRKAYNDYNLAFQAEQRQEVVARQQPIVRPAKKKKPKKKHEPVVTEPQPPVDLTPVVTEPPAEPEPQPPADIYVMPRPAKNPPAKKQPPPKPAPPADDDDWSDFWKELP